MTPDERAIRERDAAEPDEPLFGLLASRVDRRALLKIVDELRAKLAEVAGEWIEGASHHSGCGAHTGYVDYTSEPWRWVSNACTCGRDALLKAMEAPR